MDLVKIKQIALDEMFEKVHWSGEKSGKYYHGERVAKLALTLRKYILPGDERHDDIITVAGWFHDVAHGADNHALAGAERAEVLLAEYCSEYQMREIYDIMHRHDDRYSDRETFSVYAKIQQDADHLDHIGTNIIWTEFLCSARNGKNILETMENLKELQKLFWTRTEAELNFDISKKICREKIEFSRIFLERFTVEGTGEIWTGKL